MRTPNHDRDHQRLLSWDRCYSSLEYLTLRYSAGETIETLQEPAHEMFAEFARHYSAFPEKKMFLREQDAYQFILWLLGLAVLFGQTERVQQIATWFSYKPEDGCDPLIAALFVRMGVADVPRGDGLIHPKAYSYLYDAVRGDPVNPDGSDRVGAIQLYLKNWYKGMKNCYWYNRHKGQFATHFGYWSFESGLATILYELDDSSYHEMTF
ncbi:PoNe immunity protein domain-containing protein [Collimonas silvisoli]|uniref:PoNe immunity protein domain-containing protein n=1 Tax=Collimonas silvisoli TaxID=2825884 RepID=UPI001B8ABEA4|nr:PoNe immunity protein domain-containing protein [Collimonas silvisoli]